MIIYVKENDQRHYDWEEIATTFPMSRVALKSPDLKNTACTGGIVMAYTVNATAQEVSDLLIYSDNNGLFCTTTIPEGVYFCG